MESRRLSTAEKGKGLVSDDYQAPRKARVQVQEPENAFLLQKHSLTLIGRVTNPSAQKVWSLIPFFTEKWSTETRPIGADLGQGMFQFQFSNEEDLLNILDKRPYHFAKWMIIVERWRPTTAPDFPSLIPFWIKIQGIPVHLWTEDTVRTLGSNIGIFEEADITSLTVRMRVQVNGRLPLLTSSVVEYPNGDEVTANLVYEKLEKHCSKCFRLDHELRDCLQAKAEKRQLQEAMGKESAQSQSASSPGRSKQPTRQDSVFRNPTIRRDTGPRDSRDHREATYRDDRRREPYRQGGSRNYNSYSRGHSEYRSRERSPLFPHEHRRAEGRQTQSYKSHTSMYREVQKTTHDLTPRSPPMIGDRHREYGKQKEVRESEREASSGAKADPRSSDRGIPLQKTQAEIPEEVMEEAIGEIREVMTKYASCVDPVESAARKERYRLAEETGQLEEAAISLAHAALANQAQQEAEMERPTSPERVPALLRLGPSPSGKSARRSGRKPGRPPGKRTIQSSPKAIVASSSRKRKVQPKPTACRKINATLKQTTARRNQANRTGGTRSSGVSQDTPLSSDNQPLCNMIPRGKKRTKTDFQNPLPPVP